MDGHTGQNPATEIIAYHVNPDFNSHDQIFAYLKQKTQGQGLNNFQLHALAQAAVNCGWPALNGLRIGIVRFIVEHGGSPPDWRYSPDRLQTFFDQYEAEIA